MNFHGSKFYFLFLAIVVLAGVTAYRFAWLGNETRAASRIRRIGGLAIGTDVGPQWLARVMGKTYPFKSYTIVMLMDRRITDKDLSNVLPFEQVRMVMLNGTGVIGQGLACFSGLRHLHSIDLTGASITDQGLQYLGMLTNIDDLSLARTKITDQGVRHLDRLFKLNELKLYDTDVTDLGLRYLQNLPLKELDLRGTMVTSNGLANFMKINPSADVIWTPSGRKVP